MTVAVAVKVFDGIVLAADSATTAPLTGGGAQVYNHANKIFHLHRDRPVGAMTWGLGCIGSASIATLAKDLRRRLMGLDPGHVDWALDDQYSVQGVAERMVELFFDELYAPLLAGEADPSTLGFLVAGYSGGGTDSEAWLVKLENPAVRPTPESAAATDTSGWLAYAQEQATRRLFNGFDPDLPLAILGLTDPQHHQDVIDVFTKAKRQAVMPAMPFADAINLARFMVDTTIGYSAFLLGPNTVGGPVEVAGISRHEGFKWISRKHYYPSELNPGRPHEHDH